MIEVPRSAGRAVLYSHYPGLPSQFFFSSRGCREKKVCFFFQGAVKKPVGEGLGMWLTPPAVCRRAFSEALQIERK